jgi:hypothetical protein
MTARRRLRKFTWSATWEPAESSRRLSLSALSSTDRSDVRRFALGISTGWPRVCAAAVQAVRRLYVQKSLMERLRPPPQRLHKRPRTKPWRSPPASLAVAHALDPTMVHVTISRTDVPLLSGGAALACSTVQCGFKPRAGRDEEPAQGQRAAWRHGGRHRPWSHAGAAARDSMFAGWVGGPRDVVEGGASDRKQA